MGWPSHKRKNHVFSPKHDANCQRGPLYSDQPDHWAPIDRAIGDACRQKGGFVVTGLPKKLQQENIPIKRFFEIFDLPEEELYKIATRQMRPDSAYTVRGYTKLSGGFAFGEMFDLGQETLPPAVDIDGIDMLLNRNV